METKVPAHAQRCWADTRNFYVAVGDTVITFPLTAMSRALPLLRRDVPEPLVVPRAEAVPAAFETVYGLMRARGHFV